MKKTAQAQIFNPFGGNAQEQTAETKEVDKKVYQLTGISARDQVRNMLFETFIAEGDHSESESACAIEAIESAITAVITDPKSRQYRDKARQIQIKLKGPKSADIRLGIIDGSILAETVCTDEFLKASYTSGPRSASKPIVRPRTAAPGQPVRPRGPPGMVRPTGFRPGAPRMMAPIRAPVTQKRLQQTINDAPQATEEYDSQDEGITIPQVEPTSEQPPEMYQQEGQLSVESEVPVNQQQPFGYVGQQNDHQESHLSVTNNSKSEMHSQVENVKAQHQHQAQTHHLSEVEAMTSQSKAELKRQGQMQNQTQTNFQMKQNFSTEYQMPHSQETEPVVRIEASLDTTGDAAEDATFGDVSNASGISLGGKKKGKKTKKKKKKVVEAHLLTEEEKLLEQKAKIEEESTYQMQTPSLVSFVTITQISEQPVAPPEPESPSEQRQPSQRSSSASSSRAQQSTPFQIRESRVSEYHVEQTNQPPPSPRRQSYAKEEESKTPTFTRPILPTVNVKVDESEQKIENVAITEPPVQSQKTMQNANVHQTSTQSSMEANFAITSYPQMMSTSPPPEPATLNVENNSRFSDLILQENRQLREEARRFRQERNQLSQRLDQAELESESQTQLLKAELKQREVQNLHLRKELQHAQDEAESNKQRLQKAHTESQRFRESMEDQMRNALQRMQSQQVSSAQASHMQIPVSTVVMSSSSQGQGTSPNGGEVSELQKELLSMRQLCQQYEMQLQDKNHELQMRIKDLQRVERQNIALSERNKTLSDTLGELQNQNLSSMAGSGSIYSTNQHLSQNLPESGNRQIGVQHHLQQHQMIQQHQTHQLGGSSILGVHHQSATSSAQMSNGGIQNLGANGGTNSTTAQNIIGGIISVVGSANSGHHTGMGMSSGGQNMHLMNMVESGDADDGGRDGETRYFPDLTQDEGTGGESYTQQIMPHHLHHHEAIPQSSSGISGGQQFINHLHSGAGASGGIVHHQAYSSGVPGMQSSSGGLGNPSGSGQRYLISSAGVGGDYIDGGSYGQLPEGHDENSEEDDSEPENHREYENDEFNDPQDDGYDYEFIGVSNQALPNLTEMDVGGVHNETGDECDEDEDDEQQQTLSYNHMGGGNIGLGGEHSIVGGPSNNNQSSVMDFVLIPSSRLVELVEDDQIGDVEDGSRGEEGGCRESNYMEEEIEQSISNMGAGSHHQSQDAPELGVHPKNSKQQQLSVQQHMSDNGQSSYQATAGGVVETGRRKPPSQNNHHITLISSVQSSQLMTQRNAQLSGPAYEEEEGDEDIYNQHGGNEAADDDNEYASTGKANPYPEFEEEEKIDNAGAMRAPKNSSIQEDHGSSGNIKKHKNSSNLQAASGLIGSINSNSGQSSAIQGQSQSAGVGPNSNQSTHSQKHVSKTGKIQLGAAAAQSKMQHYLGQNNSNLQQINENQQQPSSMGFPDESSNGGASVSCQPQTNAVVVAQSQSQMGATQQRVVPTTSASSAALKSINMAASSPDGSSGQRNSAMMQQRNHRRGNKQQFQPHNSTNKPRQGGGSSSSGGNTNVARQNQLHQSSQQSNRNAGGATRTQRGKQSFNQQQQQLYTNGAPFGEQSQQMIVQTAAPIQQQNASSDLQQKKTSASSAIQSNNNAQLMGSANMQLMMDAPSSQASATGSSMFITQQQRLKSYSGSGSQRNIQMASGDMEERKGGMGNEHYEPMQTPSIYGGANGSIGIAQSSSIASGGLQSSQLMQSSQQLTSSQTNPQSSSSVQSSGAGGTSNSNKSKMQQMPASHASASATTAQSSQQNWQLNQNQGSKLNYMMTQAQSYQTAQAAVNQQKGVVHIPGQSQLSSNGSNGVPAPQSSQQMALAGSGTSTGSGIIPVGVSNAMMQSSGSTRVQTQEIMNAESGSTAFTNQRSLLSQNAFHRHDQSQQQQRSNFSVMGQPMLPNLTTTLSPQHHALVSSPPSTSQTGGGGISIGQPGAGQNQNQEQQHQEAASAGGGGDTDFYVAAVGAPPSSRAAAMHQSMADGNSSMIGKNNQARQQLGQGISMATDSSSSVAMQSQQPTGISNSSGQSYMHHQRQSALANNAQKQSNASGLARFNSIQQPGGGGVFSSSGGGADQQSLQHHTNFLSGSGEQEDQPNIQHQYQFGVSGSAASAAGGGSVANESAMNTSSHGFNIHQHMMGSGGQSSSQQVRETTMTSSTQQEPLVPQHQHPVASSQQMLMQGSSQNQSSPPQAQAQMQASQSASSNNTSAANNPQSQQMQHQNQGQDSRKTSGANTPSKDGADTPPYRDQNQMPHISQIYNLTSRKLKVIQNKEERTRASSVTRENAEHNSNVDGAPSNLFGD